MKTFGLELEFFVKKGRDYVVCPDTLPRDSCGYLAEARGLPHVRSLEAIHLLHADIERLHLAAKRHDLNLLLRDSAPLPAHLIQSCLRRYGKNPNQARFMYGKGYTDTALRAGLHLHFGNTRELCLPGETQAAPYALMQDMPAIIGYLDRLFSAEIKSANRIPGEYELKGYGFEYRSLPATVVKNHAKLAAALEGVASGHCYK